MHWSMRQQTWEGYPSILQYSSSAHQRVSENFRPARPSVVGWGLKTKGIYVEAAWHDRSHFVPPDWKHQLHTGSSYPSRIHSSLTILSPLRPLLPCLRPRIRVLRHLLSGSSGGIPKHPEALARLCFSSHQVHPQIMSQSSLLSTKQPMSQLKILGIF